MKGEQAGFPSAETMRRVLRALGWGGAECSLQALPGAYSNFTHLAALKGADGSRRKIVLRRYNPDKYEAGHDKHLCEYHALGMLQAAGIPAPKPLLLDETGAILGLPGIVTEFVEGEAIALPADAWRWGSRAEAAARTLARIHHVPFTQADRPYLMNDDVEVAWFIKDGKLPDYMRADADGEAVWRLVKEHWGRWTPVQPRFAHTDYWAGNILWRGVEISAVLDWEEAGYGHPAADVAYARMGYFIEGLPEAADVFLRAYEAAAGWKLEDLALFELAASARPMRSPSEWFAYPYMEAGFRQFISGATRRLAPAAGL